MCAVVLLLTVVVTVNCLTDRCAVVTYVNDESACTAVDATATDAIRLHDRSQLCLSVCSSVCLFPFLSHLLIVCLYVTPSCCCLSSDSTGTSFPVTSP